MRICIISQEYPPETARGGIGTQAYAKATGMAARGHDVFVISRSNDRQRSERVQDGVTVIRLAGSGMLVYTEAADWVTHSAGVAAEIAALHERAPIDLLEFPEYGAEAYVYLLNRTEWNYIPVAIQLHGPLVMLAQMLGWPDADSDFYRVGTHMEACSLRLADAVYSSSKLSADWAAKECGLRREDIPVLHVGIDTSLFYPREVPKEGRPTIIFVGKLVRNKGLAPLLKATCELAKEFPNLRLRILGRGEKERVAEMRAEVAAQGLNDLLDLPGYVHRNDLPEQLSRAHVFAAPSAYEGGPGFVYLEAMACGLSVIACSGSGAAEVIDPGNTGELVPADDSASLLKVLRRLLADPNAATEMGKRGRQYVREQADAQKCLDKLEAYYLGVVDRHVQKQKALADSGVTA